MIVKATDLNKLIEESKESIRRRSHLLLHDNTDDPIQSLLFALQPDTEIAIHRHPNLTETICCIRGEMAIIFFSNKGAINEIVRLTPENPICKFNPSQWHTYLCLKDDTVGWEIKEGPYLPESFEVPLWQKQYSVTQLQSFIREEG